MAYPLPVEGRRPVDPADHAAALAQSLADVLVLARLKFGNLNEEANRVFERAEAALVAYRKEQA